MRFIRIEHISLKTVTTIEEVPESELPFTIIIGPEDTSIRLFLQDKEELGPIEAHGETLKSEPMEVEL